MKKVLIFSFVMILSFASSDMMAQNTQYQTGISFKALLMDYQSQNDGSLSRVRDYSYGFEIGYSKSIQDNLNLVVPFKIGVVNDDVFDINKLDQGRTLHKTVYGLDAMIQYQFYKPEKEIVPYITGGIGFVNETEDEGEFNLQAPIGAGLQFKVAPNAYITTQGEYRFSFTEGRDNLHWGLGFVYLIGKGEAPKVKESGQLDTDLDGVVDDLDLCPAIPGLKELNGCPDTDGDGIADYQDKCPDIAGLKSLAGCPDSDGDGVIDSEDDCPNLAGLVENKGCPSGDRDNDGVPDSTDGCPDIAGPASNNGCPSGDRDNDGVPDSTDRCPDMAGPASNNGCPSQDSDNDGVPDSQDLCPNQFGSATAGGCPDRDGDGIADKDDKCPSTFGPAVYNGCPDTDGDGIDDSRDRCPNTAGPVSTNGCPEISSEDQKTLEVAMRAVQFDTGRSTLKSESFGVLNQIADIMRRYPDYNLMVSGHTDNTGSATANQKLSERRAKACYEYLTTKGISSSRLNFAGYGESRPISDNNSLRGRSLNRRVEFNLVPARG